MIARLTSKLARPLAEKLGEAVARKVPDGKQQDLAEVATTEIASFTAGKAVETAAKQVIRTTVPGLGWAFAAGDVVHAVKEVRGDASPLEKTGAVVKAGGSLIAATGVGALVGAPIAVAGAILEGYAERRAEAADGPPEAEGKP